MREYLAYGCVDATRDMHVKNVRYAYRHITPHACLGRLTVPPSTYDDSSSASTVLYGIRSTFAMSTLFAMRAGLSQSNGIPTITLKDGLSVGGRAASRPAFKPTSMAAIAPRASANTRGRGT